MPESELTPMEETNFKTKILEQYFEAFPPSQEDAEKSLCLTTGQVVLELRSIAEFDMNEVAKYMMDHNYTLDFTSGEAVWLLQHKKELP